MSIAYSGPNWLIRTAGSRLVRTALDELDAYRQTAARMSDAELTRACHRALAGDDLREFFGKPIAPSVLQRVTSVLLGEAPRPSGSPHLAVAIEAFRRSPADLPAGAQLYPQQIRAAIALVQRCALQMETGEGKTYAALPAAFALTCQLSRVYIVCANRYLAWRDATRTAPFWARTGVVAGYAEDSSPPSSWNHRVVYTTIRDLVYRDLNSEIAPRKSDAPIVYGAAILDEIDAILLDQTDQSYGLVRPVGSEAFDWSAAIEFASQLAPEDITVDRSDLSAALTVAGERKLRDAWKIEAVSSAKYLLGRYAVELSFVAHRVAEKDRDYVITSRRVVPVNRRSGHLEYGSTADWIVPLEFSLGLQSPIRNVTLNRTNPTRLLQRFQHLSGMSGSAEDDFLDYLFLQGLIPAVIPPRAQRFNGRQPDLVYRTSAEADRAVVREVRDAVESQRPVVVGTQTIQDAERVFRLLEREALEGVRLRLLTGKNERSIASALERAGEPGSVVVATQLVGRGVDIRLSDESRARGGMVLIGRSHAMQLRHDHQFLGRAGRQGDPFRAIFVCSLDDEIFVAFGGQRIQGFMRRLGMELDVPIEHRIIDQAIRRAQRTVRNTAFVNRQAAVIRERTVAEAHDTIRRWWEHLQADSDPLAPRSFVEWVAESYVERKLLPLVSAKAATQDVAERLVRIVETDLRLAPHGSLGVSPIELEGRPPSTTRGILIDGIVRVVTKAASSNEAVRFGIERALRTREVISVIGQARADLGVVAPGRTRAEAPERALQLTAVADGDPPLNSLDPFRRVGGAVGQMRLALDEGQSRRLAAVLDRLTVRLDAEAPSASAAASRSSPLLMRSPRAVACETLIGVWSHFLGDYDRAAFRIAQRGLSTLEYYRRLGDATNESWATAQDRLAETVLANLVAAADPAAVDDVFLAVDNETRASHVPQGERFAAPDAPGTTFSEPMPAETPIQQLVAQYVNATVLPVTASPATLMEFRRLIFDFATRFPPSRLQTPARILDALSESARTEMEAGVAKVRRATHREWLGEYLRYLRRRNLIGPLPTLGDRARWTIERFSRAATSATSVSAVAVLVGFFGLFLLASALGRLPEGIRLEREWILIDRLLFAGFLGAGVITAPAFPAVILARILAFFVAPQVVAAPRGSGLEPLAALLAAAVLSIWITPWPASLSPLSWALAFAVLIVAMAVSGITKHVTWFVHHKGGVSLDNLWLTGSIGLALIPYVAATSGRPAMVGAIFAVAALVAWFGPAVTSRTVPIASSRIDVSGTAVATEEVVTPTRIDGHTGFLPHLFALLFMVVIGGAIARFGEGGAASAPAGWSNPVTLAIYCAVLIGTVVMTIASRTTVAGWARALNVKRQMIAGVSSEEDLRKMLRRARWRLVAQELLTQAVLLGIAAVLLTPHASIASVPLAPLVVVAAYLAIDASRASLRNITGLMTGAATYQAPEFDLGYFQEPEPATNFWERLQELLRGRMYKVLGLVLILSKLVEIVFQLLSMWRDTRPTP